MNSLTVGQLFQKLCGVNPDLKVIIAQDDQYLGSIVRTVAYGVEIEDGELIIHD